MENLESVTRADEPRRKRKREGERERERELGGDEVKR